MKRFLLAAVLVSGCGGQSFSGLEAQQSEVDGGGLVAPDGGLGGSGGAGSGGATGSSGASAGGSSGTGTGVGGVTGTGGAPPSAGGVTGSGGATGTGGALSVCSNGDSRCSGVIPTLRQTCVAGAWTNESAACSGNTPICFSGACVACNPGAKQCAPGGQPQLCVSGAWTGSGSACDSACLSGTCVACNPGATQCEGGTQPQTCGASGAWQNSGSPVTHDNGLGQTWQDCVPLGTYNVTQAMKACKASGAASCQMVTVCGPLLPEVRGYNADGSKIIGRWGYVGALAGYVGTGTLGELCSGSSDPNNRTWN